jgi:acyl dehydratase
VAEIEVGAELPATPVRVTRADLVRYAGASGDFNPIHWSDRVAGEVGDPSAVRGLSVRFTRPVVVPDDEEGALVEFSGIVSGVADVAAGRLVTVTVKAVFEGRTVLGKAVAEVLVP